MDNQVENCLQGNNLGSRVNLVEIYQNLSNPFDRVSGSVGMYKL